MYLDQDLENTNVAQKCGVFLGVKVTVNNYSVISLSITFCSEMLSDGTQLFLEKEMQVVILCLEEWLFCKLTSD